MRVVVVIAVLVAAVLSAYWDVRTFEFISLDDPEYVGENKQVQAGLTAAGVRWAFDIDGHVANWHPLTWLSHMLDYELFGNSPGKHHMMSAGLHALNAVLLLATMLMLTRALWPSAVVAMLWAVHPLRVESVAWIAERKDLLSGMFGLTTLLAYGWYARRPSLLRGATVFMSLALGLMCKPMLVTWPLLMLVLDAWPLRRVAWARPADVDRFHVDNPAPSVRRLLMEKIPLAALAAASCAITYRAQQRGGAVVDDTSMASRFANAAVSIVRYLGDTFWPTKLAAYYPRPPHWPALTVIAATALLAIITIVALATWRKRPWLLVGWLWFVGTLIPVLGLVQVGEQAMADRYTYLPQIGVLVAVVWTCWHAMAERRAIFFMLAVVVWATLWIETRRQVGYWRDSSTLYRHALNVTTDNPMMETLMAGEAVKRGDMRAVAEHRRRALAIRPDSTFFLAAFGELSARAGDMHEATLLFDRAVAIDPHNPLLANNLAWMLATSPDPRVRSSPRVLELAQHACDLTEPTAPEYAGYLDTLSAAQAAAGRFTEARQTAAKALELALQLDQKDLATQIMSRMQQYDAKPRPQ